MSALLDRRRELLADKISRRMPDEILECLSTEKDLDSVAQRAINAIPRKHLGQFVGPVYNTKGLRNLLDVSRETISQYVKKNQLLGIRTNNGFVFPLFQFEEGVEKLTVRSEIKEILEIFAGSVDGATIAYWLNKPVTVPGRNEQNPTETPLDFISKGDVELLYSIAREYAHLWR